MDSTATSATATATASKKRKLFQDRHEEKEEEEDKEEEQMEEFFALVRSIRDARARLMINGSYHDQKKQRPENSTELKIRRLEEDKPVIEPWKPTFQREDFLPEEPRQVIRPPTSSQNKRGTDQDLKQGLDLTLSL